MSRPGTRKGKSRRRPLIRGSKALVKSGNFSSGPLTSDRREFLRHLGLISLALGLGARQLACGGEEEALYLPPVSIDIPSYRTTLLQTLVPAQPAVWPEDPESIGDAEQEEFGILVPGAGESHLLRNDLGADADGPEERISLLYLVHLSDIHLVDDESPARFVGMDSPGPSSGAYRPQDNLTVQVLDAMIRTLNHFSAGRAYDLLVISGDGIDNNQFNELRWLIDVLDGKEVNPDSGADDDPAPGPVNDFGDPFRARGLDPRVPWYMVVGNHDGLVQGTVSPDSWLNLVATGDTALSGTRDGSSLEAGKVRAGSTVAADPERNLVGLQLSPRDFIREFFHTSSRPAGHGFTEEGLEKGRGYYSFGPGAAVPIRFIALETYHREGPDSGEMSTDQLVNFLIPELERAKTEGKLVVLISHHSPDYFEESDVSGEELISTLNSYPNVILHLTGHGHLNRVTPRIGSDSEHGYWEVQTSSLIDFPQQARIIEIVDNGDGTGSIYCTMVDHNSPEGTMAAASRSLALSDVQTGQGDYGHEGTPEDRNVELRFQVPAELLDALRQAGGREKIESLTTLKEEKVPSD